MLLERVHRIEIACLSATENGVEPFVVSGVDDAHAAFPNLALDTVGPDLAHGVKIVRARSSLSDFESNWRSAVRFRPVSHALKTLVFNVTVEAEGNPVDESALRAALDHLLAFLSSPGGRTDANCCAVDRFFAPLEGRWQHLPPALAGVISDLTGTLHDTVYAPQIAAHFESLPEQLLNRLRKMP